MDPRELQNQTISARATTTLVGREAQLAEIDHVILQDNGAWLLQITGRGGIGKTRLLVEILDRVRANPDVLAARAPVDLYHSKTHSVEGLMSAISAVLDPAGANFTAYLDARQALDRYLAEPSGQARKLQSLRENVQAAFLSDLSALASGRRLVLALDTAEKLVYQTTEVERRLGLTEMHLATWEWLRDRFLPSIQNAVVILAGRPQLAELTESPDSLKGVTFQSFALPGFTAGEALQYFDAVAQDAADQGSPTVAQRIRSLPEDWRRTLAEKAGGRPILLALVVDYLVIEPAPPYNLREMDELALEKELVRATQETARPTDEAVRALAWARKGMNSELLARVTGHQGANGSWDTDWAQAAVDQLKGLSFIKIRPSDQRVFLHDEMYDLMDRHVLQPSVNPVEARRVYQAILRYYQESIAVLQSDLLVAYEALSTADVGTEDLGRIYQISSQLQDARVERLHYELRSDARRGFSVYYRYAEEAALGENAGMDSELRAELLGYLNDRDPLGQEAIVDGLSLAAVLADGAIRWVKRFVAAEQYGEAVQLATEIRKQHMLNAGDTLSLTELMVWDALAQLYGGLMTAEQAARDLEMAVESLDDLPRSWRRDAVLARVYNNLGYARRTMGLYRGAIGAYKNASHFWSAVKINAERANTLNNRAFAQAEIGELDTAGRQAKEALNLRRESGARPQIGLSLSTMAQIAIREGLFVTAQRYAKQALTLFQATNEIRGQGMAQIGLAEAKRRYGAEGLVTNDEANEFLSQAIDHAQEACDDFVDANEPIRRIEALIELGCGYRDYLKVRRRHSNDRSLIESLAQESRGQFQEAARLAKEKKLLHFELDALINEAWLEYYVEAYYRWMADSPDVEAGKQAGRRVEELLAQADKLPPTFYQITERDGVPPLDPERIVVPVLSRIGKLQLLHGQRAFNEFEDGGNVKNLRLAIEYYTLSLAYDYLVSDSPFRDKRRAQDRIYERMTKLNPADWQEVFATVHNVESRFMLGRSQMRGFLQDNFDDEENLTTVDYDSSDLPMG